MRPAIARGDWRLLKARVSAAMVARETDWNEHVT